MNKYSSKFSHVKSIDLYVTSNIYASIKFFGQAPNIKNHLKITSKLAYQRLTSFCLLLWKNIIRGPKPFLDYRPFLSVYKFNNFLQNINISLNKTFFSNITFFWYIKINKILENRFFYSRKFLLNINSLFTFRNL